MYTKQIISSPCSSICYQVNIFYDTDYQLSNQTKLQLYMIIKQYI